MQQRQQKETTPTTGITNKPQIRTHTQTCMHKHMHNIHILLSESERRILLWNNPQRQICAIFTTGSARPLTLPHLPPVHPSFTASLSRCVHVYLCGLASWLAKPQVHTHTHTSILVEPVTRRQSTATMETTATEAAAAATMATTTANHIHKPVQRNSSQAKQPTAGPSQSRLCVEDLARSSSQRQSPSSSSSGSNSSA